MTRTIRPWEMPQVETIAREFHDLANLKTVFSPDRFWQTVNTMARADALFLHGMFVDGRLAGMLLGTIAPQMFTDTIVAQEIMWYVRPSERNGIGSIRLLHAFEAWAKNRGANGIVMASFAATADEKLSAFYTRRGYALIETHFLKHL